MGWSFANFRRLSGWSLITKCIQPLRSRQAWRLRRPGGNITIATLKDPLRKNFKQTSHYLIMLMACSNTSGAINLGIIFKPEAPLPQPCILGGYFVRILRQIWLLADDLAGYFQRRGVRQIQVLYLPN